jgi:hypothetical protein
MSLSPELRELFLQRAGIGPDLDLVELVEAIRSIPHGRPRERSGEAVVKDWRGTCSTKHDLLGKLRPDLELRFVHRLFRLHRDVARAQLGEEFAREVPEAGCLDFHTYATILVDGRRIAIDVTFPGEPWDGQSDMPVSCGPGEDFPAETGEPYASKDTLVKEHCDPRLRELLVAALSMSS